MTQLPPIASDVDLRDFAFMPLEVARLLGSEVVSTPDAEVFRANVLSWCVAWHQVPAGSLPDDDATLARLLGYGRDLRTWRKVRAAGGLRHWEKATDDRLYHPLVAEKALEAWIEKLLQRKSSAAGNAKRWNTEFDAQAMDDALALASEMLTRLNPLSRSLQKLVRRTAVRTPGAHPGGTKNDPGGNAENIQSESQETGTGTVEGTGTGNLKKEVNPKPPVSGLPVVQPTFNLGDDDDPLDLPAIADRSAEGQAVNLWNEMAARCGLSRVDKLTKVRRTKLKARLADCGGIEGWKAALAKVESIPGLRGLANNSGKHEGWRADFDFLLTESKFVKLMEGGYDHWGTGQSTDRVDDAWNNAFGGNANEIA